MQAIGRGFQGLGLLVIAGSTGTGGSGVAINLHQHFTQPNSTAPVDGTCPSNDYSYYELMTFGGMAGNAGGLLIWGLGKALEICGGPRAGYDNLGSGPDLDSSDKS